MQYKKILLILLYVFSCRSFSVEKKIPIIRRISENKQPELDKLKIFMIDIDGTICETKQSDYLNSIPKKEHILLFNKLYEDGNEVHYWTARGVKSGKDWDDYTIQQLKKWGVKYTSINMGKPHYDVWIDDKSFNAKTLDYFFTHLNI